MQIAKNQIHDAEIENTIFKHLSPIVYSSLSFLILNLAKIYAQIEPIDQNNGIII